MKLSSRLFQKKIKKTDKTGEDEVVNYANHLLYPEHKSNNRMDVELLFKKLSEYDVVSFDIFDTLILRPLARPTDLFYLLESRNGMFNFIELRRLAEERARQKTTKPNYEVDIYDIYDELSRYYKIDKDKAIIDEINTEMDLCYANPYIKQVYDKLEKSGKTIIAVSDMYIPEKLMKKILNSCGYNIQNIFVSCDYGVSKLNGLLQKKAMNLIGTNFKYIHIGDNYNSDIFGSKKAGWDAYHYQMTHDMGRKYRQINATSFASSLYNGVIDNHIYAGPYLNSNLYEFGYSYAGVIVDGVCTWINDICKFNKVDKILFMARDMDIFYKAYKKYYNEYPSEYVISSRFALQQLIVSKYP